MAERLSLLGLGRSELDFLDAASQDLQLINQSTDQPDGSLNQFSKELAKSFVLDPKKTGPIMDMAREALLATGVKGATDRGLKVKIPTGLLTNVTPPTVGKERDALMNLLNNEKFQQLGPRTKQKTLALFGKLAESLNRADKLEVDLFKAVTSGNLEIDAGEKKKASKVDLSGDDIEKFIRPRRSAKELLPFADTFRFLDEARRSPNREVSKFASTLGETFTTEAANPIWREIGKYVTSIFGVGDNVLSTKEKTKAKKLFESGDFQGYQKLLRDNGILTQRGIEEAQKKVANLFVAKMQNSDARLGMTDDQLNFFARNLADDMTRTLEALAFEQAAALNDGRPTDKDLDVAKVISAINAGDFSSVVFSFENAVDRFNRQAKDNLEVLKTMEESGATNVRPTMKRLEEQLGWKRFEFLNPALKQLLPSLGIEQR